MIEIQNIIDKDEKEIINLLLNEKEQPFEIYIPKSTKLYFSESSEIANDYAMLAYAGQRLSEVAQEFDYWYVSPVDHKSVLFEITAKDIELLANTILYLSDGYNNPSEDGFSYIDEVYSFIEKVKSKEIIPICPDFIEDYEEYSREALDVEDN